ncbi:MAG TPA: hypothetical protein VGM67_17780 [Gemmatimonadaceae bacterium]|jgi:adhesin/invasin
MRAFLRSSATAILALATVTCSDTPVAGPRPTADPGTRNVGHVSFVPTFSRSAQFAAANAVAFGVRYDSVHVVLRGFPDTTVIVKDTTVFFSSDGSDSTLTLDLTVPVTSDGQRFDAGIGFTFGGIVQFYGHGQVRSHRSDEPAPDMPPIVIDYAGPGSKAARVVINPRSETIKAGESDDFTATVFDSSGATLTSPIDWITSDANIATVGSTGRVSALSHRGTATISALTPNLVSDQVSVTVVLPPASIALVGGDGQTGKVGAALANAFVVQVNASDSVGVSGVNVTFSPPTGGSVGSTSVTTDANGRASTTLRLGNTVGQQSFVASAAGFVVGIAATATAGDPAAVAVVSGNSQADTIHSVLAPLSVRVTDQFNNPVAGTSVTWARSAGGGSLGSGTSTTNLDGVASNTYTLGSVVGAEGVTASIAGGTISPVTFSFTVRGGAATNIAAVSGANQTGRVGSALANPFVVAVTDAGGNVVSNVGVTWSATNGSIASSSTSDAGGQASATLTAGTTIGPATVTATIPNGSNVLFTATIQVGLVSQMVFTAQPVNGTPNVTLSPVSIALHDVGGNATTATNSVTIALGNNPGSATLSGTLTRSAVGGVATFDDLKIDKASDGYTLSATSNSLPSVTSTSFSMAAGAATTMAISAGNGQSAQVNATVGTAPAVKVTDASGNPVSGISVKFVPASGSGSVVPSSEIVVTNAQGIAALTSWTLGATAGTQSLVVSATGLSNVTISATATAGSSTGLAISAGDAQTATVNTAVTNAPAVKITDGSGNPIVGVSVTFTPSSGSVAPSGGVVSTNAQGVATLTSWTLGTAAGSQSLVASATGLSSVTISATATAGSGSQLQITTEPATSATSGVTLTRQPVIQVADQYGNAATADGMTIVAAPSAGTATGNSVAANATSGVATFTNLAITTAASSVTVSFAVQGTPSITGGPSSSITIGQPTASQLILVPSTPTTFSKVAGGAVGSPPTVKTTDANGDAVGNTQVLFTVTQSGTTVGTPQTLTSDATTGLIATSGLNTPDLAGTYTITASLVATPSVTTSVTLVVSAGSADHLVVSTAPLIGTASGTTTLSMPSVTVQDAYNNAVNNATVYWRTGSFCASGFTVDAASKQSNSNGVVTEALNVPSGVAGSCQVMGSLSSSFSVPSTTFTIDAIMAPSGVDTWLGTSSDAAWATASNWTDAATPTNSSSVFIPGAVPSPKLLADGVAGSIALETGSTNVALQTHTLTVSGDVKSSTGGINNGTLDIEGAGATYVVGTLPTTVIGNATSCGSSSYTLAGATTAGPVTVNCTLTVGGYSLTTISGGGLTVGGSAGKLVMTNSSGFIDIAGAATFGGASETGSLTNGTAKFSGGLTVSANGTTYDTYAPSGSHTTEFMGTSTQHVSVCTMTTGCATPPALYNVDFASSSHVYFDHSAAINGTFTAGTNSVVESAGGTTLTVAGDVTTQSGSNLQNVEKMTLTGGTRFPHFGGSSTPATIVLQADLSLDQYTALSGNLEAQQTLTVGSNTMTVGGNFSTTGSTGLLNETTANGLVDVSGTSTFAGHDETGSLTNGTFESRGNFSQLSTVSGSSYAPSGAHKTSLWGGSNQTVSFADPTNSFFWDVDVRNSGITAEFTSQATAKNNFTIVRSGSSGNPQATFDQTFNVGGDFLAGNGTVVVAHGSGKRIIVAGAVSDSSSTDLGGIDSLRITGTVFPVYRNTSSGKAPKLTQLTGAVSLTNATQTVAGGLNVQGSLDMAGKTLTVVDSLNIFGTMGVSNAAGRLVVGGKFTENGSSTTAFAPVAGFKVTLNGASGTGQAVNFGHLGSASSYFADLDVTNTTSSGVNFTSDGLVKGTLAVGTNAVLSSSGGTALTAGIATGASGSKLSGVQQLTVTGTTFPVFAGAANVSSPLKTIVTGNSTLVSDPTFTGALSVQSFVQIGGRVLTINGDFTVENGGLLKMASSNDSVVVGGNATFNGGDQSVGGAPFAAGAFDFKGNFTASGTNTFNQSGTGVNTAYFSGSAAQTITVGGTGNNFGNMVIRNTSAGGVTLGSNTQILKNFTQSGVFDITAAAGTVTVFGSSIFSGSSVTTADGYFILGSSTTIASGAMLKGSGQFNAGNSCSDGGFIRGLFTGTFFCNP